VQLNDITWRVQAWPFIHHLEVTVSAHRQAADGSLQPVLGFGFTMDEPPADLDPRKQLQEVLVAVIEHL